MTQEEKARAYDEALETARKINSGEGVPAPDGWSICEIIFPELRESEDERVRKALITFFQRFPYTNLYDNGLNAKDVIAWLEKQGEQDNNEDSNVLQRFSFYSYKDEPNILYLSGLYVNEECRNKGIGTKILEVADKVAKSLNYRTIRLKTKKNSNAERLYRAHGYNSLTTEEKDWIWLEKQNEQEMDKVEKIKAEIERKKSLADKENENMYFFARSDAYRELLNFIDSLEEEPDCIYSHTKQPQITIGTRIRSKANPDVILSIISDDCHEDEFECSNGSVLSLKQIEKYYDLIT